MNDSAIKTKEFDADQRSIAYLALVLAAVLSYKFGNSELNNLLRKLLNSFETSDTFFNKIFERIKDNKFLFKLVVELSRLEKGKFNIGNRYVLFNIKSINEIRTILNIEMSKNEIDFSNLDITLDEFFENEDDYIFSIFYRDRERAINLDFEAVMTMQKLALELNLWKENIKVYPAFTKNISIENNLNDKNKHTIMTINESFSAKILLDSFSNPTSSPSTMLSYNANLLVSKVTDVHKEGEFTYSYYFELSSDNSKSTVLPLQSIYGTAITKESAFYNDLEILFKNIELGYIVNSF
jgi:hypothetical protein